MVERTAKENYEQLRKYLEFDPDNLSLARDCAEAAMASDLPGVAFEVLAPFLRSSGIDEALLNLAGVAAMRSGDQTKAQDLFARILENQPDSADVRFNLGWSRALAGDFQGAIDALNEDAIESLPQAAMLDLQMRHELGQFDEAAERLEAYVERFPDYAPLQAAASVLAMDVARADLARQCAERAGDHPDALATRGALDLGEQRIAEARELFKRSIAQREKNPRAYLGLGLAELAAKCPSDAAVHLDRGAEQFGDHLGSWLAAGWAYFLAGDIQAARSRFEKTLAIDDTFGEAHGSLAALDALAGDIDEAERRMKIALRLDRQSFAAALTGVILAEARGNEAAAKRIFEKATKQPMTHEGRTLADLLARIAL